MKRANRLATWAIICTLLGVATVVASQAQTVTFDYIADASPGQYFDAATTAPDPSDPNRLIIGFYTGFSEFKASSEGLSRRSATDSISFVVTPPDGYCVAGMTYAQTGTARTGRTGAVGGSVVWIVNELGAELGLLSVNDPDASGSIDLSDRCRRFVHVVITNALCAYATPSGSATIATDYAEVLVELMERDG